MPTLLTAHFILLVDGVNAGGFSSSVVSMAVTSMYGGSDDGGAVAMLNCLLMVLMPVVLAAAWCRWQ